jgi:hypothetical protein
MSRLRSAYSVDMPRPPKVVSISKVVPGTEQKAKLIARDEETNRIIVGIGSQRLAFDVTTRVTHLRPHTGDQTASVVPLHSRRADTDDCTLAPTPTLNSSDVSSGGNPGKRKKPTKP